MAEAKMTERPVSPHMQIYRWPLPMLMSILHRITGCALYFGTLLMAWWLTAAGSGPKAYGKVAGWLYMKDFTPLVPRGIAVTKGAADPGAAKAFVNWLYTVPGQKTACAAGFTAYRRGVACPNALSNVQRAAKTYLVPISNEVAAAHRGFVGRWHKAFG